MPDFVDPPPARRILALDVGKKRIGLAISDPLGISAQGLPTLHRTRIRDDLEALNTLARERGVALFLVGRPLHMSGEESSQSAYTMEFAERLRDKTGIPVSYWDERLTSRQAERVLRQAKTSVERRKEAVDKLAAVLLLESYLDARQNAPGGAVE